MRQELERDSGGDNRHCGRAEGMSDYYNDLDKHSRSSINTYVVCGSQRSDAGFTSVQRLELTPLVHVT